MWHSVYLLRSCVWVWWATDDIWGDHRSFILPFNLGPPSLSRSPDPVLRHESSISAPRSDPNPIFCTSKSCHCPEEFGIQCYIDFWPKNRKITQIVLPQQSLKKLSMTWYNLSMICSEPMITPSVYSKTEFIAAGFFNIRRGIWSCLTISSGRRKRRAESDIFWESEFPL